MAFPAAPIAFPPTNAPSVSSPVLKSSLPLANVCAACLVASTRLRITPVFRTSIL